MSGLWIMLLGGVMFMFVGGEVKHMAFAVGGAILFSGTNSINFNQAWFQYYFWMLVYASFIYGFFVGFFYVECSQSKL